MIDDNDNMMMMMMILYHLVFESPILGGVDPSTSPCFLSFQTPFTTIIACNDLI